MATDLLTREELHERVDALFDEIESYYEEPAVAVIGAPTGGGRTMAPSESTDLYRITSTVGWAPYTFDALTERKGLNRIQQGPPSDLFGTLIVPESDLSEIVRAALDGDDDAIEAVVSGEAAEDGFVYPNDQGEASDGA